MAMLETPSRIWRRIEATEGHDMPSLPSLPAFEDSGVDPSLSHSSDQDSDPDISAPYHSTPTNSSLNTARAPPSASSTARFAQSIASRGGRSMSSNSAHFSVANSMRRSSKSQDQLQSFDDISMIPSLPQVDPEVGSDLDDSDMELGSMEGHRGNILRIDRGAQDDDEGLSLADALRSVSRTSSPFPPDESEVEHTQKHEYSVSLKSEPKASPFNKMRNVSFRRPVPRMRTPSLTRTTSSPESSTSNSTPHSSRSFAASRSQAASPVTALNIHLPQSNNASPAGISLPPSRNASQQSQENTSYPSGDSGPQEVDDGLDVSLPEISHPVDELPESHSQTDSDERELTFSSGAAPTPRSHMSSPALSLAPSNISGRSPPVFSTAQSSPAPSIAFTPTPAFQPRPRARFLAVSPAPNSNFGVPSTPAVLNAQVAEDDDPTTPFARRRSFLMDVINSTARPRLAHPTPYTHQIADTPASALLQTPAPVSVIDEVDESASTTPAPAARLQAAFVGITPLPRPRARGGRLSHPLAHGWTVSSESEDVAHSDAGSQSPYDVMAERASFISTASSHDLNGHPRANASFDPLMGLGAGGHGVGRFNANKLNTYLHGLNRRLQEENENMTTTNIALKEEIAMLLGNINALKGQTRRGEGRRVSGVRRVSDIGTTLGHVAEDVGGEGWMEEKVAMEEELEGLREQFDTCMQEREEALQRLEDQQAERAKDKEQWKRRMDEVERGVTQIVGDLEAKLEAAVERAHGVEARETKIKELQRAMEGSEAERQFSEQRAEKAERMLEHEAGFSGELREANERLGKVMADLREAHAQIEHLETEVTRSGDRAAALEQNAREDRGRIQRLEEELDEKEVNLADAERQLTDKATALHKAQDKLNNAQTYIAGLESDVATAKESVLTLKDELASAHDQLKDAMVSENQMNEEMGRLEEEADRNAELARQLEEALEAAETKIQADEGTIAELRNKIATLDRERERDHTRSRIDPSMNQDAAVEEAMGQVEALENELDNAHREIGRLNAQLSQSPARRAIEKSRESRIEMLEKEKGELLERIKNMKSAMISMSTPSKGANGSVMSPFHRQLLNMTMKTPKTPGGPLKDMSWLHPSMGEPSATAYATGIAHLQKELDRANEDIDEKLDRLWDAGFGVVELTQQLEDERARNSTLEEDVARLVRREERRVRRLEKARCPKCRSKVDLRSLNRAAEGDESSIDFSSMSLMSEHPASTSKTSEALRAELQTVNQRLKTMKRQWEDEKQQLLGDKAALQDATHRLNLQVQDAKDRIAAKERAGEKAKAGIQGELDQANRVISDLEKALKTERTRLRSLSTEQRQVDREKSDVLLQLRRAESDMEDIMQQLQRVKKNNNELEAELRVNTIADQKARLLEAKTAENMETIEQLRQERSLLATDHKSLQRRFTEVSERMKKLRDEHAASQNSHENRRHALDLHLLEIEDLKQQLAERTDALKATEAAKSDARRVSSKDKDQEYREREREIAALEADLARVRRSAEALGKDLRAEREKREEERKAEKAKAGEVKRELEHTKREVQNVERARKQATAEVRVLRERTGALEDELNNWAKHICATDDSTVGALRTQHKEESKGLMLQIRYLKAKWTRENMLRVGLSEQKKYLLVLLTRHERGDRKVLAAIAQIGFPVVDSVPKPRRRPLKAVAMSLIFLVRVGRSSDKWREERASRPLLRAALEDVRRRRVQPGPSRQRTS